MGKPIHLTDDTFDSEVLKSDIPVIVDFWATWCAPCRMIAPIIEQFASEYEGRVKVCKLDVDNNQQVAMNYGIRSIPTVSIFKNGEVVDTIVGAVPKTMLKERLEAHL
ncbi:MAG: thioredoxin [Candidatus Kapaibacteriota bacterium]